MFLIAFAILLPAPGSAIPHSNGGVTPQAPAAPREQRPIKGFVMGSAAVIDGDSLTVAGRTVHLRGIDAPEDGQTCIDQEGRGYDCGAWAKNELARIIAGHAVVTCLQRDSDQAGEALSQCFKRLGGASKQDIGAVLVTRGWALEWFEYSGGLYSADSFSAQANGRGLWAGTFVNPWDWRNGVRDVDGE